MDPIAIGFYSHVRELLRNCTNPTKILADLGAVHQVYL